MQNFKLNSIKFRLIKVQLIVGLFLFSAIGYAQKDTIFWKNFKKENSLIHKLLRIDLDSALKESNRLMSTVKQPIDSLRWSSLLMTQGHIYADLGDFEKANAKYLETARIREKLKNQSYAAAAYQSMANLHFFMNQYEEVFTDAKKSIKYYSMDEEQLIQIGAVYNLIGLSQHHLNQDDSALFYFQSALDIYDKSENVAKEDYSMVYTNMGLSHLKNENYDLGLKYLKKGAENRSPDEWNVDLARDYIYLTYAYIKQEKYDSAKIYLKKAELTTPEALTLSDRRDLLSYKLEIATYTGDVDSLVWVMVDYKAVIDSLSSQVINSNIQDAQTKYEVEKKDAAIKLANEEAQKLEAQNIAKNRLLLAAVAVFLFLLVSGIYYYRSTKQKERLTKLQLEVKSQELNEMLSNQENEVFSSILKGQEKERERIAMDLHDRLGGTLAALRISLKKPKYGIEKDDFSILETAITEVRSISHNLSTGLLNKYGLSEAVSKLFTTLENSKGIHFSVFFHPQTAKLGQGVGIELYRIVQELVSNTLKHASASEVSLKTAVEDWKFTLIYEDNGKGFDLDKNQGGIGLENIKTRVNNINGNLEVNSQIGEGAKFLVTISLDPLKG